MSLLKGPDLGDIVLAYAKAEVRRLCLLRVERQLGIEADDAGTQAAQAVKVQRNLATRIIRKDNELGGTAPRVYRALVKRDVDKVEAARLALGAEASPLVKQLLETTMLPDEAARQHHRYEQRLLANPALDGDPRVMLHQAMQDPRAMLSLD